jgi:hypothetical protein
MPLSLVSGATSGNPESINNSGETVGGVYDAASGIDEAYEWSPTGSALLLKDNSGRSYNACAINKYGDSVGGDGVDAIYWDPAGNETILQPLAGWVRRGGCRSQRFRSFRGVVLVRRSTPTGMLLDCHRGADQSGRLLKNSFPPQFDSVSDSIGFRCVHRFDPTQRTFSAAC